MISSHPFYNSSFDRYAAEACVRRSGMPVLRKSSIQGHYAITYLYNRRILHTLLCQNSDRSIDVVMECGTIVNHFPTVYAVLDAITPTATTATTAESPLMSSVRSVARSAFSDVHSVAHSVARSVAAMTTAHDPCGSSSNNSISEDPI